MRFFHVADLHLGRRFRQDHQPKISRKRREELWKALEIIISTGKKEGIDALFLSGDIYEREFFTISDYHRLGEMLESLAPIKVFIIGGNHDYFTKDSYLLQMDFSNHITIFSKEEVEFFDWEEKKVRIMGLSWNHPLYHKPIEKRMFSIRPGFDHVLLLHGTYEGDDYMPFTLEAVKDFTYVALGHIHKPITYTNMAYPGSTVPMSFKDVGNHGYIVGEIKDGICHITSRHLFLRRFYTISYHLEDQGFMEVKGDLQKEMGHPNGCYRLTFTGTTPQWWSLEELKEVLKDEGDYIEIEDETTSPWDLDYLLAGEHGELMAGFIEYIQQSKESPEIKERALQIGLSEVREDGIWKL